MKNNLEPNKTNSNPIYLIITIIYIILLLFISLRFSITWSNPRDYLRMFFFIGLIIFPIVILALISWLMIKPKRKYLFLTLVTFVSFFLVIIGSLLEKAVIKSISRYYWSDHMGLLHFVNNIILAISVTLYFSFPYFLLIGIFKETSIKNKSLFIKIIAGFGIAILVLIQIFLLFLSISLGAN